jgi:hypothetical protein
MCPSSSALPPPIMPYPSRPTSKEAPAEALWAGPEGLSGLKISVDVSATTSISYRS